MTSQDTMGLKLRRFKAKLNWKTKETVPEVVCLRYQIHSEFQDPLGSIPTTSNQVDTDIGTNEVIKPKKPISKPPVQSVFESISSTTVETNDINSTAEKTDTLKTDENLFETASLPAPPTKGILKKPTYEDDTNEEINSDNNLDVLAKNSNEDADDLKKSALIYMTENHDYNEEAGLQIKDKHEVEPMLNEAQPIMNTVSDETTEIENNDEEEVELRNKNEDTQENKTEPNFEQKSNREHKTSTTSSVDSEQDGKTVRWRETVIEIKPNLQLDTDMKETSFIETEDNSTDDFKVHFVKHNDISTKRLQNEDSETESENDNNEPDMAYYGNRGAYSSQAASIFFAGEEPELAPRIRNVQQDDDDDVDENMKSKSS